MDGGLLDGAMRRVRLMAGLAVCLLTAAGLFAAYRAGAFLPGWISWQERRLEGTAGEPEAMVLADRTLQVLDGEAVLWQTAEGVLVQDALWCDIDRDGGRELLLLCWRRGRYGPSRPFWEEEKTDWGWSQHIFLYRWTGETMRPLWMASDVGREVTGWSFDETRRLTLTDRDGQVTAWDWVSWGLTNIPLPQRTAGEGPSK